jgi:hypothetical protein
MSRIPRHLFVTGSLVLLAFFVGCSATTSSVGTGNPPNATPTVAGTVPPTPGITPTTGPAGSPTVVSGSATPTIASGATPTPAPGSPTLNGCVNQQPPSDANQPADFTEGAGGGIDGLSISMTVKQTIVIRLTATMRWTLTATDSGRNLVPASGNDWYDPALRMCVWRFQASGTGRVVLLFAGQLVCAPEVQCPLVVQEQSYIITIK